MNQPLINSLILFALSCVSGWFWYQKNRTDRLATEAISNAERKAEAAAKEAQRLADEADRWQSRVTDLETQVKLVNATVVPISTAFQAMLIKRLTHFHTPEMDALMVKLGPPNVITGDEATRLATLLEQRAVDMGDEIPESERVAAKALPLVMILVKEELETLKDPAALQIVKVPLTETTDGTGGETLQT